jgi:hypothetical protein
VRHDCDFDFMVVLGAVVDGLAEPTVSLSEGMIVAFYENVGAQSDLKEVVAFDDGVEFVGFAVLHEPRAPVEDEVKVNGYD